MNGERGWRRSARASGRGLLLALESVAGIPLFLVTLFCLVIIPAGLGVLLAPESLLVVRRRASRQRRQALEWSGVRIPDPYRPRPAAATGGLRGQLRYCRWVLTDPATWRDLLWMLPGCPAGLLFGLGPTALTFVGCWVLGLDWGAVVYGWWPGAPPTAGFQVMYMCMLVAGLTALALSQRVFKVHARIASVLLAPTRTEMAAQVGRLTESRSQVVDASAAELRRIERDLHDGAQARLVSVGMSIGLAEQVVREYPDLALSLLAEARAANGQALSELRALVRGIHPPVLAERGLDGAVRALALSLPVPVDVQAEMPGRVPAPVEAAAYFAVAEALANVVKHSGAPRAWVQLDYADGRLVAIVGDNGTGGAEPRPGGGLHGIEQRLAAFDGVIAVTSPPGGPTLVTMELPCELSWART
ncbi:MAG TPA: histidine kinase [Streptosporangiaceae bacterium]|nr:histidine kinase [Streptosporangiaceae bacterium]